MIWSLRHPPPKLSFAAVLDLSLDPCIPFSHLCLLPLFQEITGVESRHRREVEELQTQLRRQELQHKDLQERLQVRRIWGVGT